MAILFRPGPAGPFDPPITTGGALSTPNTSPRATRPVRQSPQGPGAAHSADRDRAGLRYIARPPRRPWSATSRRQQVAPVGSGAALLWWACGLGVWPWAESGEVLRLPSAQGGRGTIPRRVRFARSGHPPLR